MHFVFFFNMGQWTLSINFEFFIEHKTVDRTQEHHLYCTRTGRQNEKNFAYFIEYGTVSRVQKPLALY
jgi:hypothetical protein